MQALTDYIGEIYQIDPQAVDESENEKWKGWALLAECYGPRDGAVADGCCFWSDESLEMSIIHMFRAYCAVLEETAAKVAGANEGHLMNVIEPSYEDSSAVVIYHSTSQRVILSFYMKAWNFYWDSVQEFAEYMEEDFNTMVEALRKR
jgi:hypothetical protein